jgi:hypothetical protein
VRKWLILPVCAGLAVVALLVWSGVEDARQAALLDARFQHAQSRALNLDGRLERLRQDRAPAWEVEEAERDSHEAWKEAVTLAREEWRREESWHARLLAEVQRRTGW